MAAVACRWSFSTRPKLIAMDFSVPIEYGCRCLFTIQKGCATSPEGVSQPFDVNEYQWESNFSPAMPEAISPTQTHCPGLPISWNTKALKINVPIIPSPVQMA